MENKPTDFDVDYEEKENSVFKVKKPKKVWVHGRNYFRITIEVSVVLIIFVIFFVFYNREWFGFSGTPKNYFSIIQSENQYDCGDKYKEAENLKPTPLTEIDIKTKELNALGDVLKEEKVALDKEKTGIKDELSLSIYKNNVGEYNTKLESYTVELEKHQKEIDGYNEKVKAYYDFLKGSCVLVK
ncbi:MAG: hypothetical protein WC827_03060 [Candidatus Paceibacterota bacterium]|jgi:hypothetical protein